MTKYIMQKAEPKIYKDKFLSLDSKGLNKHMIHSQIVRFPATISVRQAVEILTNGCCGD